MAFYCTATGCRRIARYGTQKAPDGISWYAQKASRKLRGYWCEEHAEIEASERSKKGGISLRKV